MKIYLSGKMSGLPDWNYPEFDRVAAILRQLGYDVLSPAENLSGFSYDDYMIIDIGYVMACDMVVLLPGDDWKTSNGVFIEAEKAICLGKPIRHFDEVVPR